MVFQNTFGDTLLELVITLIQKNQKQTPCPSCSTPSSSRHGGSRLHLMKLETWNAGLTKEDPRVAAALEKRETALYKEKASQRMRRSRLSGKIPTQTKENHSQWRGGTSPLNNYCRANRKLYTDWKYPLLEKAQFKCQECSKPGPGLEIHHDKEKMCDIIHRFATQYGWSGFYSLQSETDIVTIKIKIKISNAVAQYHIDNNVSGKVLCETCHKEHH